MPSGLAVVAIAGPLGAFSSLLGIGGGTIAITVMTWCSRTIHRSIATASGIGTLIAVPTAIGFAIIGYGHAGLPWGSLGYINLPAAVAISCMSVLTAPLGVAAAHRLPASPLKRVFGGYLWLSRCSCSGTPSRPSARSVRKPRRAFSEPVRGDEYGRRRFQQPCAVPASRTVVLIVEDEMLIRMLLAEALRQADYEVVEAANGEEALSVLHASPDPDVLITDVRMPGAVDGFELAAYVRRSKPRLKVIITSGHAGPDGAIRPRRRLPAQALPTRRAGRAGREPDRDR